ncbi:hypothetical protein WG66_005126 [Moniliophthora roreri]|nr:hypothetical protein WG66_005126 [Moniliophthora roreri]
MVAIARRCSGSKGYTLHFGISGILGLLQKPTTMPKNLGSLLSSSFRIHTICRSQRVKWFRWRVLKSKLMTRKKDSLDICGKLWWSPTPMVFSLVQKLGSA